MSYKAHVKNMIAVTCRTMICSQSYIIILSNMYSEVSRVFKAV